MKFGQSRLLGVPVSSWTKSHNLFFHFMLAYVPRIPHYPHTIHINTMLVAKHPEPLVWACFPECRLIGCRLTANLAVTTPKFAPTISASQHLSALFIVAIVVKELKLDKDGGTFSESFRAQSKEGGQKKAAQRSNNSDKIYYTCLNLNTEVYTTYIYIFILNI